MSRFAMPEFATVYSENFTCGNFSVGRNLLDYSEPRTVCVQSLRLLWRRCREEPRNSRAWEEFLSCVHGRIWRIAGRVALMWGVRERADIEDLFQEICLKISRQSPFVSDDVLKDDSAAEAYLTVLSVNAARDVMRTRFAGKRGAQLTQAIEDHAQSILAAVDDKTIRRDILLAEVENLLEGSPRDHSVFWLYYKQGFTAKEISKIPVIGLSQKGVESLILRMTSALRARIAERGAPGRSAAEGSVSY
jgi:RNA polymerase sigma-70 factor, ECF subfamily